MFDRPVTYHRVFVGITGSIAAAVFLTEAVYFSRGENWFYINPTDWERDTGLKLDEIENIQLLLDGMGLLWFKEWQGKTLLKVKYHVLDGLLNAKMERSGSHDHA